MTKATEKWLKNIYFIVSINKQEANQNLKADRNFKAATETAEQGEETGERGREREMVKRERQRRGRAEVAKQFSTRLSVGLDFFITHTHAHPSMHTHAHTKRQGKS